MGQDERVDGDVDACPETIALCPSVLHVYNQNRKRNTLMAISCTISDGVD